MNHSFHPIQEVLGPPQVQQCLLTLTLQEVQVDQEFLKFQEDLVHKLNVL